MNAIRVALEREIYELHMEMLRIDDNGEFVHDDTEKWEIAKQLGYLEARVQEWRA